MSYFYEPPLTRQQASERVETAPGRKISGPSSLTAPKSKCPSCGVPYAKKRKHQTFCSSKCRKAFWVKDRTVHPGTDIRIKLDAILARLTAIEKHLRIEDGR